MFLQQNFLFFQKLFDNHKLLEAKEVTLAANMNKTESFERLKWKLDPTYGL